MPDLPGRSWLRSAGKRTSTASTGVRTRIHRIATGTISRLVGSPDRYATRALVAVIVLSGFGLLVGSFLLVTSSIDTSANSGPLARAVAELVTNFFVYAGIVLLAALGLLRYWWVLAARQTAQETRFDARTVRRLSAEVRSTDGTVRLIGTAEHSEDQLRAKLLRAFEGMTGSERPGDDVDISRPTPTQTGAAIDAGEEPVAALEDDSDAPASENIPDSKASGGASSDDATTADTVASNTEDYDAESGLTDEEIIDIVSEVNAQFRPVDDDDLVLDAFKDVEENHDDQDDSDDDDLVTDGGRDRDSDNDDSDSSWLSDPPDTHDTEAVSDDESNTWMFDDAENADAGENDSDAAPTPAEIDTERPAVIDEAEAISSVGDEDLGRLGGLGDRSDDGDNSDDGDADALDDGDEDDNEELALDVVAPDDSDVNGGDDGADDGTGDADEDEAGDADDDSDERDSGPGALTRFKQATQTFRMDLATSINFEEIAWRFGLPFLAVWIGVFTIAGTPWFSVFVYPLIFMAALLVGAASYTLFKWRRRRSLKKLRRERSREAWSSSAALAKTVETPDQTMYVVWVGGRVYADYEKHRLAKKVANRWRARLSGDDVAPAIQEKFARNIAQMLPTLRQFRLGDPHEGIPGIEDDLVDVLREATNPDGLVPKHRLCKQVVDRGEGVGHDPDLVAAVYEDLVPRALTETDVTVTDTDGNEHTITAVRLRWMDLPDDLSHIRAQFSTRFRPRELDGQTTGTATGLGAYELPEIERAEDMAQRAKTPAEVDHLLSSAQPKS